VHYDNDKQDQCDEARCWMKPQILAARWIKAECQTWDKWETKWGCKSGQKCLMKGIWPKYHWFDPWGHSKGEEGDSNDGMTSKIQTDIDKGTSSRRALELQCKSSSMDSWKEWNIEHALKRCWADSAAQHPNQHWEDEINPQLANNALVGSYCHDWFPWIRKWT